MIKNILPRAFSINEIQIKKIRKKKGSHGNFLRDLMIAEWITFSSSFCAAGQNTDGGGRISFVAAQGRAAVPLVRRILSKNVSSWPLFLQRE
jgi:hypothetical protein